MSDIRANTISDAAGTGPIALTGQRALAFFADLDQVTPGISDSLNASSFADNGTGIFSVSYTNSFSSTAYTKFGTAGKAPGAGSSSNTGFLEGLEKSDQSASSFRSQVYNLSGTLRDSDKISVGVIGDLA